MSVPITAARRAVEKTMTHVCRIQRGTVPYTDDYGQPGPVTWTDHQTDVPCRFGQLTDAEVFAAERNRERAGYALLLAHDTDVTAGDRVTAVTAADGTVLAAGPLSVAGIVHAETHLRLTLEGG